jgi:hypothetical protein
MTNGVYDAPLKQWTHEYAIALRDQRLAHNAANPEQPIPDPSTFTWVFDTEADLALANGKNGVHMIKQLALRPALWNAPLPWDPANSLASLYNAGIAAYGFAPDANGVPGIASFPEGVHTTEQAYSEANGRYMPWVYEQYQRCEDFVMKNCAFDTLKAVFPGTSVGNYDDFNADGKIPPASNPGEGFRVGWMQQRPYGTPNYNLDPPNPLAPAWTSTSFFPRRAIHQGAGGPLWREEGAAGTNQGFQWYLASKRVASGDHESPPFYGLGTTELDWFDGVGGKPGHRQKQQYGPGHPDEDDWSTAMRFHRRTAETIINSCVGGAAEPCERQARLVPWLEMVATESGSYPTGTRHGNELREMLAMLRGKNLAEGIFWSNWWIVDDGSINLPHLQDAWTYTKNAVDDVYATRVHAFQRVTGLLNAVETDAEETSRLEFTLLLSGAPRTVDVTSRTLLVPPADGLRSWTQMIVDFRIGEPIAAPEAILARVECSTTRADTVGFVEVGTRQPNGTWLWTIMDSYDFNETHQPRGSCYYFHAPVDPDQQVYRNRRSLRTSVQSGYFWTEPSEPNITKIRLRLTHRSTAAITSRYDLVQLYHEIPSGIGTMSALAAPMSDATGDGVISDTDLDQYITDWLGNEPAADLNLDQTVGEADLDAFVEAYLTGT